MSLHWWVCAQARVGSVPGVAVVMGMCTCASGQRSVCRCFQEVCACADGQRNVYRCIGGCVHLRKWMSAHALADSGVCVAVRV